MFKTGVNMKKIILLCLLTYSLSIFSAVPTMEGLFRNGSNEILSGNLVVFDIMVVEQPKIQEIEEKTKENFLKLIFFQEDDKSINLYQFQYSDSQMSDKNIVRFAKVSNLSGKLKGDLNLERSVLFAVLKMIGLNNSNSITYILKKLNQDFKFNREILNWEKMALYKEYRDFLSEKDKSSKPSPLNPIRPEDKTRVDNLLKSSMYKNTGDVKLVKKDGDFYWLVELDKSTALFSNENHYLKEMKLKFQKGSIELDFDEYISLNGMQPIPGQIMIKDINERFYKIKFLSFNISQTSSGKVEEKYKDVQTIGTAPVENSFPGIFLF
jgi:hypothetical protein